MYGMKRSRDADAPLDLTRESRDVELNRVRLLDTVQEMVTAVMPDAQTSHNMNGLYAEDSDGQERGVIQISSERFGQMTCCYEEPVVFHAAKHDTDQALWRYVSGFTLRAARELGFLSTPAAEEKDLDDHKVLAAFARADSARTTDERVAQLMSLVQTLVNANILLEKRVMELSDSVRVCESRLDLAQLGERAKDEERRPALPLRLTLLDSPPASPRAPKVDSDDMESDDLQNTSDYDVKD